MKKFWQSYSDFIILLAVYFISELVVWPLGEFPLNDDWSYARSVLILEREGRVDIGDWPAMTLVTHVLWGDLFVRLFGFSFFTLRVSTWVSTVVLLWFMRGLLLKMGIDRLVIFVATATLLYNPVFFNMTNTYMTDINFLCLMLVGSYFVFLFFERPGVANTLPVFFVSLSLVLLRQYGIVLPAAFAFSCLFLGHHRWKYFFWGLIYTVAVYVVLLWYESYLRQILPQHAAYKFSGMINPTQRLFWDNLWYGVSTRYKIVMIHALFYSFPLTVIYLPSVIRQLRWKFLLVLLPFLAGTYFLYEGYPLQVGNVFLDTAVGVDTTYETLVGTYVDFPHFFNRTFEGISSFLKYLFIGLSLSLLAVAAVGRFRIGEVKDLKIVYLLFLLCAYLVMILITESFFDRYQIPVIACSLMILSYFYRNRTNAWKWAVLPLLLLFYVSVFGTKDYFKLSRIKWDAYHDLIEKEKIPAMKINAGIESVCWNEGEYAPWYNFSDLRLFDYLIQFRREESFSVHREIPFQRYFPPRMDTVRVFKRSGQSPAPKKPA